jgi:hypothetical protein
MHNFHYKKQIHSQKLCDSDITIYDKNKILLDNKANICLSMCDGANNNEFIDLIVGK